MKTLSLLVMMCGCLAAAEEAIQPRQVGPFGRTPITEEPGRYVLGGYVDTTFGAVHEEEDDGQDNPISGFNASAGMEGMVRLVPEAIAVLSATATSQIPDRVSVEQAYVRYDRGQAYIRLGRTHQWFGWERFDAPELWRINKSYTYYNSGSLDGGTLGWRLDQAWRVELSAANEIITPRDHSAGKTGTDLGYGAKLHWDAGDGRVWDLTVFIDKATSPDLDSGGYGDVSVLSTWGEWRHIAGSRWSAAMDVAYAQNPNGSQLFALGALRIDGRLRWPGFATLMATWLQEDYDASAITAGSVQDLTIFGNQRLELALAGFCYPTEDYHLRVGCELRALDSTVAGEDELSAHLEALYILH